MEKTFCLATAVGLALSLSCGDPGVAGTGGPGSSGNGGSGGTGGGFTLPDAGPPGSTPPGSGGSGQPPTSMNNCGLKKYDLMKRPADLLLVLDRSGSMRETVTVMRGMEAEKWGEVVAAVDTVVMRTQATVGWGLKVFPTPNACGVPDGFTVPIGANNHAALMMGVTGNQPPPLDMKASALTPTRNAVAKALAAIQSSPSPNAKHLLLATDGQPNCQNGSGSQDDVAGSVQAVAASLAAGVPVFVIGIATTQGSAHNTLNMMADAGGRPRMNQIRYYPASSRDELIAALESITGQIASCTFPLNPPPPVPANVAVDVDGMRVNRDTNQTNGWDYSPGNTSITIHGPICDRLKAGTAKDVQIIYGCGSTVIP